MLTMVHEETFSYLVKVDSLSVDMSTSFNDTLSLQSFSFRLTSHNLRRYFCILLNDKVRVKWETYI